jgi:hypothetical protein
MTIFMAVISPVGPSSYTNSYGIVNRFPVSRDGIAAKPSHINSCPVILNMSLVMLMSRDCLEAARFLRQVASARGHVSLF